MERLTHLEDHFCCRRIWKIFGKEVIIKYNLIHYKPKVYLIDDENSIVIIFTFEEENILFEKSNADMIINVDEMGRILSVSLKKENLDGKLLFLRGIILDLLNFNSYDTADLIKKDFMIRQIEVVEKIVKTYFSETSSSLTSA